MTDGITLILDGKEIPAKPGQTIIEAADAAGIYIPRLCHKPGLEPYGSCRVCTVKANGRPVAACTQPVSPGMVVENETAELQAQRRLILEMLFVEGNHFCMSCEKSGNCELQALGYRFGISAPQLEYQFPVREVDASHPDILIDHNRCILCGRCVRTSRDLDGKNVFGFIGRGPHKKIAVSSGARLADTDADVTDRALDACPVGALLKKRVGFAVPVGQRLYDKKPIGTEVEALEGGRK
jgi:[NiFe] hydrogenase diaphorase moiety small subunit